MQKLKTVDADTLLSTPLPANQFVVERLLPRGLHILAGASKVGKSWLALWLCLCVAKGGAGLGFDHRPGNRPLSLSGGQPLPYPGPAVSTHRERACRAALRHYGRKYRQRAGGADRRVPPDVPGHRAGGHRYLAEGADIQLRRQPLCQRLSGPLLAESISTTSGAPPMARRGRCSARRIRSWNGT